MKNSIEPKEGITYLPVEVVNLKSCSKEAFIERFLNPGVPCILEDLVHDWPAYNKWTKEYFMQKQGQISVCYHHIKKESDRVPPWLTNLVSS